MNGSKFWDDFVPGEKTRSYARRMTEADIRFMIGACGGSHPLHTDPYFCAAREDVGAPILPGSMVLGLVDSFFNESVCPGDAVLAMPAGYDKIRLLKPIYEDDILQADFVVTRKEDQEGPAGLVAFDITVSNQDQIAVLFAAERFLVEKRAEK